MTRVSSRPRAARQGMAQCAEGGDRPRRPGGRTGVSGCDRGLCRMAVRIFRPRHRRNRQPPARRPPRTPPRLWTASKRIRLERFRFEQHGKQAMSTAIQDHAFPGSPTRPNPSPEGLQASICTIFRRSRRRRPKKWEQMRSGESGGSTIGALNRGFPGQRRSECVFASRCLGFRVPKLHRRERTEPGH